MGDFHHRAVFVIVVTSSVSVDAPSLLLCKRLRVIITEVPPVIVVVVPIFNLLQSAVVVQVVPSPEVHGGIILGCGIVAVVASSFARDVVDQGGEAAWIRLVQFGIETSSTGLDEAVLQTLGVRDCLPG